MLWKVQACSLNEQDQRGACWPLAWTGQKLPSDPPQPCLGSAFHAYSQSLSLCGPACWGNRRLLRPHSLHSL